MLQALKDKPESLREPEYLSVILDVWCCPFSGVAVMCNRETPRHRDPNGRDNWYDLLFTMGTYDNLDLLLPGLNSAFCYTPGTVVALCGRVLSHEAKSIISGDRVCYAWFMREDVRRYLHGPEGTYSNVRSILKYGLE